MRTSSSSRMTSWEVRASTRRRTAGLTPVPTCARTTPSWVICFRISTLLSRRGHHWSWTRILSRGLPLLSRRLSDSPIIGFVLSVFAARPAVRAAAIAIYILLAEWSRALISTQSRAAMGALVLGGLALVVTAAGWPLERLGLGRSRFAFRILGGLALAAVLLLPAAVRSSEVPILPAFLVLPAVVVAVGEEIAFRGALYAALEDLGAPVAIIGTTALWIAAHALSHPPQFLVAVAAAGLLLALWRWACKDLVAPIIGHVIADIAL